MERAYKNSRFAGEMLVAAELSRLGYEVMLGNVGSYNTKAFDMTAVCPISGVAASISVKALKKENAFLIDPEKVLHSAVYVFVITGAAGSSPQFFVIRGAEVLEQELHLFGRYGRSYRTKHGRGIAYKKLLPYRDNWRVLEPDRSNDT